MVESGQRGDRHGMSPSSTLWAKMKDQDTRYSTKLEEIGGTETLLVETVLQDTG